MTREYRLTVKHITKSFKNEKSTEYFCDNMKSRNN